MKDFYKQQPGAVISTAINKYIYIAVNHQFDGRIIATYLKTEIVKKVDDLENDLIREALKMTGVKKGIHITSIADIPSEGSGLGSSSSYLVGLLHALYAFQGKYVSSERLASEACEIEINILKKPIGKQDQYIAAYGGFQYIQFNANGTVYVNPVILKEATKDRLEKRLTLFYTGITRSSSTILTEQKKNINQDKEKIEVLKKMVSFAQLTRDQLQLGKLNNFGELLDESWNCKKSLSKNISNVTIDNWYKMAKKKGAIGGKILGAGGGGFFIFYSSEKNKNTIARGLADLTRVDFQFEPQGSKIIFVGE